MLLASTAPTLTLIEETAPDPVAPYRLQVILPPSPVSVLLPTVMVPMVDVVALAVPDKLAEPKARADTPINTALLRQPSLVVNLFRKLGRWIMYVIRPPRFK